MASGTLWIIAGLIGCGAEMVVPGVFLLPIGVAAVLTGVAAWAFDLGWTAQWLWFSAGMVVLVSLAAWRMRRAARVPGRVMDRLNGPDAGLIGATCRAVTFAGGQGRVLLGDGAWPARLANGALPYPAEGTVMLVVGLEGTTLVVTPRLGAG